MGSACSLYFLVWSSDSCSRAQSSLQLWRLASARAGGIESARVKLNSKNLPVLIRLLLLCMVVCTLAWELVQRLLALAGVALDLSLGPIGFDIQVISLYVQANPGTLLGIIPAIILFRRV